MSPPYLREIPGVQHYDRQGNEITIHEHYDLSVQGGRDRGYRRVADNNIGQIRGCDGLGVFRVSTVWLGMDVMEGLTPGPPLIFETMAFDHITGETDMWRWPTEDMAVTCHRTLVRFARGKWRKTPNKHKIRSSTSDDAGSIFQYFVYSE